MAGGEAPAKKSDLGVRTLSAIVMVAIAGTALWLGGWVWTLFVAVVALGVLWEWRGLVAGFEPSPMKRGLWNAGGLVYVGLGAGMLGLIRQHDEGTIAVLAIVLCVIATDVGAYFAGRAIGGPKIAPRISPSKTWAGLGGGMLGAGLAMSLVVGSARYALSGSTGGALNLAASYLSAESVWAMFAGGLVAVIAQTGDFFESWMKRRAGIKDSSNLIPGHGGLFDRVDGLLAVCFVTALIPLVFFGYDAFRLGYIPQ